MSDRILTGGSAQTLGAPPTIPQGPGLDELHELRVRIPTNLHRQLLSLKILRGRSLADTVSIALDVYFAQVKTSAARTQDMPTDDPARR